MEKLAFHLIGNAHIDPVWLWDWREGLNEGLITCRTLLDLMDEDPQLTFNRGEALLYEHIEKTDPEAFARIKAYVQRGRWGLIGGTYLQSDENLPDTETLLRQYVRGQRYFTSRFGRPVEAGWSADCFGHSAGFPEILAAAGLRFFSCTRPFKEQLPLARPAFWWVGPGASRILTYRPLATWYCTERGELPARLDQTLAASAQSGLRTVAVFYGLGNHGGGPTRRHLADIRAWGERHPEVSLVHSTLERFFRELEEEVRSRPADFLPVHQGELNFAERGCYSTMARLKFPYRRTRAQLARAEATDAVIAARLGRPPADLSRAWDAVLFNSFHDILPGTCIERACDEQIAHLGEAFRLSQEAEFHALNGLAASVDTRVRPAEQPDLPTGLPFLVWNPHPHEFEGFVELEGSLDYRPIWKYEHHPEDLPVSILDAGNHPLPFQMVATEHTSMTTVPWRKRAVVPVRLPPLGWSVLEMAYREDAGAAPRPCAPRKPALYVEGALENSLYKIETQMGAPGLRIWRKGLPFLGGAGLGAALFDDPYGSWGGAENDPGAIDISSLKETWRVAALHVLEKGPWRTSLWVRMAGQRSRLDLTVRLYSDTDAVEVLARVFWDERLARLKLSFPVGDRAEFEVPGGSVVRGPCGEVPGGRWIRVPGSGGDGFGFVSDTLHNFDTKDGVLRATVARSSRFAHTARILEDHPWQPAADSGELRFRFLLAPGGADLPRLAQQLEQPPVVLTVPAKPGKMPRAGSLMRVEPDNLRLLAFKPALDGRGWILRLQEMAGKPAQPRLTLLDQALTLDTIPPRRILSWRIQAQAQGYQARICDATEKDLVVRENS